MEIFKKFFYGFNVLILLILFSYFCFAQAGISPAKTIVNFEPNTEIRFDLKLYGYNDITYDISCPDVVQIYDIQKHDGHHLVKALFNFSEKMKVPGKNNCGIRFNEMGGQGSSAISAIAAVGHKIIINVPYPGRYAIMDFDVQNANKGEPVIFKFNVVNMGEEVLSNIKIPIQIFNSKGNLLDLIFTDPVTLKRFGNKEIVKVWDTSNVDSAEYLAIATLNYGGDEQIIKEQSFLIGKKSVEFLDATQNGSLGEVNPFNVMVKSWWGDEIKNVYANVQMQNASGIDAGEFKTVSMDLKPWEETTLNAFWDSRELVEGKYFANITIFYEGGFTHAQSNFLILGEPTGLESFFNVTKNIILSPITLIIIIVVLILLDVVLLINKKKKKKKNEKK